MVKRRKALIYMGLGEGRRGRRGRLGVVLIHQLNRQRVDIRLHEVPKGRVDAAVGLDPAQPLQGRSGDADAEMAAAVAGTGVPAVLVTLVDDFAGRGLEARLQALANQSDTLRTHGST